MTTSNIEYSDGAEKLLPLKLQRVRYDYQYISKPSLTKEMLSLLNIPEEFSDYVRIMDSVDIPEKGILHLAHYIVKEPFVEIQHCRGIVIFCPIDTEEKISKIAWSFPWTEDNSSNDFDYEEKIGDNATSVIARDGTILRIFNFDDTWYISTHKKINGLNSKWSCQKTFGQMLAECLEIQEYTPTCIEDFFNQNNVDKSLSLVLLLCHPDNRIVCEYTIPQVYIVSYIYKKDMVLYTTNINPPFDFHKKYKNIIVPSQALPSDRLSGKSRAQVYDIVNKEYGNWKDMSGLLILSKTGIVKINSEEYNSYSELRGNEPNLRIRWLELKTQNRHKNLEKMFETTHLEYFKQLESDYKKVVSDYIYVLYKRRYIERTVSILPKEEHYILNKAFKTKQKTNIQDKKEFVNFLTKVWEEFNPRVQNALIRNMNSPWRNSCKGE